MPLSPRPLVLAVALTLAAAAGCKKQAPAAPAPEPVAMPAPAPTPAAPAVRVTSVDLGNRAGSDLRVSAPTSTFAPGDTIIAAVGTDAGLGADVPGRLGVKWTHLDSGQTVHEETRTVQFSGTGTTDFQISKPDGWPTGRYHVDILLDGQVVQGRDFEVR